MTPNALTALDGLEMAEALRRHAFGDWGHASPEDALANDQALTDEARIISIYEDCRGTRFWVVTEADRSATTILLPQDYGA